MNALNKITSALALILLTTLSISSNANAEKLNNLCKRGQNVIVNTHPQKDKNFTFSICENKGEMKGTYNIIMGYPNSEIMFQKTISKDNFTIMSSEYPGGSNTSLVVSLDPDDVEQGIGYEIIETMAKGDKPELFYTMRYYSDVYNQEPYETDLISKGTIFNIFDSNFQELESSY